MEERMKILFLTHRGITQASSRYRVYQYIDGLRAEGFKCHVRPLPERGLFVRVLYIFTLLISSLNKDIILIQKILFPIPVIYGLKFLNKNLIFDWDDAIYTESPSGILSKKEVNKRIYKLNSTLKVCKLIICGNGHLEKYSLRFNKNLVVIPTSLNTNLYTVKKEHDSSPLIIGWIGSSANLTYLQKLKGVLQGICERYKDKIFFKVVCDKVFNTDSKINIINKKWNLKEEVSDIRSFDIGIMPLEDNEWTRGKCAFKALQYMAVGIPVVSSPVGVNRQIIEDGVNGYLADSIEEWERKLSILINMSSEERKMMGQRGRGVVVARFSHEVALKALISVFNQMVRKETLSLRTH